MSQNIWQIETLIKIKKSTVLADFFIKQRLLSIPPSAGIEWNDSIEKFIIAILLRRYQARRSRDFERSDAYCLVLIRLGLDMEALEQELHPSRTTPQDLLEGK